MMFRTTNVYAMITGFNVRVKDEREQDRNHLVEVTVELPLPYALAGEILPAMAHDLFTEGPSGPVPKIEMQESVFALDTKPQIMEVRTHPELAADCRIPGVGLRRIKAKKTDAGTWVLVFTATWTLGDPKEAILMIQRLKQGVYMSLEEQEPTLPMDGDQPQADPVAAAKNVTPMKGRRKRGQTPEAEQQQQLGEGQKKLEAGEPAAGEDAAGDTAQP